MPRLLVNPGSPTEWRIQLRDGVTTIGRSVTNDFQIDDPSVSYAHCEIHTGNGTVLLRDLDSTNGTTLEDARVVEAALLPGQVFYIGSVKLLVEGGEGEIATPAAPVPYRSAAPAGAVSERRTKYPVPQQPGPAVVGAATLPSPPIPVRISPPPNSAAGLPASGAPACCKFHPRTFARFRCRKCGRSFCDLCVNTHGDRHTCRTCAEICDPIRVELRRPEAPKGFYARLPSAFLYPFQGSGSMVVIFGTILFTVLGVVGPASFSPAAMIASMAFRMSVFGFAASIILWGYVFAYVQEVIHSTVNGDEQLPDLPGIGNPWDDLGLPFLQLLGILFVCFGPVIGFSILAMGFDIKAPILLGAIFWAGVVYLPMAYLSVAVMGTVLAANPIHVIRSIIRVPIEYLVTVIGTRVCGGRLANGRMVRAPGFPIQADDFQHGAAGRLPRPFARVERGLVLFDGRRRSHARRAVPGEKRPPRLAGPRLRAGYASGGTFSIDNRIRPDTIPIQHSQSTLLCHDSWLTLVVLPAWPIDLKAGVTTLGRGIANDFKIDDPSVSTSHCHVIFENGALMIRDLGSTNRTKINQQPITESPLQFGQVIHLGSVELALESDGSEAVHVNTVAEHPGAHSGSRMRIPAPGGLRISRPHAPEAAERHARSRRAAHCATGG